MKKIIKLMLGLILVCSCSDEKANNYFHLGEASFARGDNYGAIIDYTNAIEIKHHFPEAYLNRGIAKSQIKDLMGAIEDYSQAIKMSPNYDKAFLNRSNAKCDLKNYTGALEDCQRALEINPRYGYAYTSRGIIKYYLEDYNGALVDYNKALEISSNDGFAYYNRGTLNYKLNHIEDACLDWNKAGDLGVKEAAGSIERYCKNKLGSDNNQFVCSNCNEIKFRNPGYGYYNDDTNVLFHISVVNNTKYVLWQIDIEYRCLDSNGDETDSGNYEFGGLLRPYMKANSAKREDCDFRFPVGGQIVFEIKSFKVWPCPTDTPC